MSEKSGHIVVRTAPALHEHLAACAEGQGVSLNQYAVAALASVSGWERNGSEPMSAGQRKRMYAACADIDRGRKQPAGTAQKEAYAWIGEQLSQEVLSSTDLTFDQAHELLDHLDRERSRS